MKPILTAIVLLTFAIGAVAQNSIRLFDPVAVGASDPNFLLNSSPYGMFKSAQVYLHCPTSGRLTSSLSGPNGGALIVDNTLLVNDTNVCAGNCFSSVVNPWGFVGMPVEAAYGGVGPINVSREITGSGLYTFNLLDFGQVYGSSAIYLNTNCSITPIDTPIEPDPLPGAAIICHLNNGNNGGQQTLLVGAPAVAAHLGHGDTLGACGQ